MLKHTDQLYRLAELPAFIEEALSNVSLKGIIGAYSSGHNWEIIRELDEAIHGYAEQWVDEWLTRNPSPLYDISDLDDSPEIRAIEAGVKLFSNPDCKAGLPE